MMREAILKRSVASVSAISMMAALSVAMPAHAQGAAEADAPQVAGEIVVTARKREENLLKVPVTVTALTSETLEKRGVVSMQDLASSTPALNINNNSSGHADRSFQQIVLRGFTPSTTLATTTSLFIDGVAVSSPSAFTAISAPERIEILKGPQSAYFGRNTFAGAINVVNKTPSGEWAGELTGMVGTRDNYRLRGEVEGSIIGDALTFRLSGERFSKSGSWKNAADGSTLGDQSTNSGSLLIVAKPTEKLTIKAFGLVSQDKDGPSAQTRLLAYDIKDAAGNVLYKSQSNCTLTGNSVGVQGFGTATSNPFICGTLPGLVNPVSANTVNDSITSNFLAIPQRRTVPAKDGVDGYGLLRNYHHLHAAIDYELSDILSASVLAGYNYEEWTTMIDLDGNDTSAIASTTNPRGYFDFPFLIERRTRDYSAEGRLSLDTGALRGVVGVSYLNAYLIQGQGGGIGALTQAVLTPGGKNINKTIGAFYGLTYDFTDTLSLSVEGRYQIDTLEAHAAPTGQVVASSAFVPAGTYAPGQLLAKKKFKNFLPRVIANWQATPSTMIYASFSKGVNPSQFNSSIIAQTARVQQAAVDAGVTLTVDPEKITNYEAGIKGRALDGRLRYTAAAYFAQWRNQINAILLTIPDAGSATGTSFVNGFSNSGTVDIKGLEIETSLKLSDLITIDAAGAYTDTKIKDFRSTQVSKLTGIFDYSGKEMPNTSKWSANVGVQFAGDLRGFDDASWFLRGDWNFKSGMWSNQANTTRTADLHLFNLRTGVSKGKVSFEVFVNNVFNNKTYTSIADNYVIDQTLSRLGNFSAVLVGLPELRTAGIQMKVAF
ncbi:TonB-dependent receptor [Rhizorhabdus phycosphaerae]|uniref:TonB-dependent receptor n=1 Tax=Rhizorhabdus phycosphaerae TaxID=2711156 RepID=UPI0013EA8F1C|nr:TonB-dependent receptor [Rhizorhabdus phycosphaerae]